MELTKSYNPQNWYAVYTKPRNEKKSAERLELRGYEVYCPLKISIRQWSDRIKKVEVPALPSYIFVKIKEHQQIGILQDSGIIKFIYEQGQPAKIKDKEITALKDFISQNIYQNFQIQQFKKGDKVTILKNPVKNRSGTIESTSTRKSILILESLNMAIKIKVENEFIIKQNKNSK